MTPFFLRPNKGACITTKIIVALPKLTIFRHRLLLTLTVDKLNQKKKASEGI